MYMMTGRVARTFLLNNYTEMLFGRKVRATLPVIIRNRLPDKESIQERLQYRQSTQKSQRDKTARTTGLSALHQKQVVMMQDDTTKLWYPGTVMDRWKQPS